MKKLQQPAHSTTTTSSGGEAKPPREHLKPITGGKTVDVAAQKQIIKATLGKIHKVLAEPKNIGKAATILAHWINKRR